MIKEEEHLNLLAIFYYIKGGLNLAVGVVMIIMPCVGLVMIFSDPPQANNPDVLRMIGWIYLVSGIFTVVLCIALGSALILAGSRLRARTHHQFCFVMAVICCLNVPLGLILGIFTILTLNKPQVKELFKSY